MKSPMPKRDGKKWTPSEESRLKTMFDDRFPIEGIANDLNRKTDAIAHKLIELGVIGYVEDLYRPDRHRKYWTKEEISKLKKEFNDGWNIEKIALGHNRQKNAILHKLVDLRILDYSDRNILENLKNKKPKTHSDKQKKGLYSPWCPNCQKYKGKQAECPHCGNVEE